MGAERERDLKKFGGAEREVAGAVSGLNRLLTIHSNLTINLIDIVIVIIHLHSVVNFRISNSLSSL